MQYYIYILKLLMCYDYYLIFALFDTALFEFIKLNLSVQCSLERINEE